MIFSLEVSNDSASLQWRITTPVVESIYIRSQYFLLQKHKGKGGKVRSFWSTFHLKMDEHYRNFVCRTRWVRAGIAE